MSILVNPSCYVHAGSAGIAGLTGATGLPGNLGPKGATGQQGVAGPDGTGKINNFYESSADWAIIDLLACIVQ